MSDTNGKFEKFRSGYKPSLTPLKTPGFESLYCRQASYNEIRKFFARAKPKDVDSEGNIKDEKKGFEITIEMIVAMVVDESGDSIFDSPQGREYLASQVGFRSLTDVRDELFVANGLLEPDAASLEKKVQIGQTGAPAG